MNGCSTSPISGIWWMNATIGVTNIGPITGSCCRNANGGVCSIATTAGAAVGTTASVVRLFVTTLAALLRLGTVANDSRRAAASMVHVNGDSTGAVGALPAKGLKKALTT